MKIKQIYIINLKRRKDKLKKIMKRINEIDKDEDINVEIFCAIDGHNINDDYLTKNNIKRLEDWSDPFKNTKINCGEIGCAESHYRVWELIIKNNYNGCLILEDDASFVDDFIKKVEKIDLPNDADLLYFGRKKFGEKEKKYSKEFIKPEFSYWLVGYYLTYSGALKLVNSNFIQNIIPVDEFVPIAYGKDHPKSNRKYSENFKVEKLTAYALKDNLIQPSDGAFLDSETEDSRAFSNNKEIHKDHRLKIITFLDNDDELNNDYFTRFKESTAKFNLQYVAISSKNNKMNSLKEYLNNHQDDKELLMITEYRNTIFTTSYNEVIDKFLDYSKDILFGCSKIGDKDYISTGTDVYRYINNTLFIGYGNKIKEYLNYINNITSLKEKLSNDITGELDHNCQIFFNISDSLNDFNLDIIQSRLLNKIKHNIPVVISCNNDKNSNIIFNNITNYIPLNFRASYGYNSQYDLKDGISSKKILIEIVDIDINLKNTIMNLSKIDYQKNNIKIVYYDGNVEKNSDYIDIIKIKKGELDVSDFDYVLQIHNNITFTQQDVFKTLIKRNKNIIAPFIVNKKESKPNYGMFIDKENNKPLPDFNGILQGQFKGCWKVTEVNSIYLIKANIYKHVCQEIKHNDYFMYVDNTELYGYIE
jgi:GR25 family glycosyltransferase involved in LPS biosynthesis